MFNVCSEIISSRLDWLMMGFFQKNKKRWGIVGLFFFINKVKDSVKTVWQRKAVFAACTSFFPLIFITASNSSLQPKRIQNDIQNNLAAKDFFLLAEENKFTCTIAQQLHTNCPRSTINEWCTIFFYIHYTNFTNHVLKNTTTHSQAREQTTILHFQQDKQTINNKYWLPPCPQGISNKKNNNMSVKRYTECIINSGLTGCVG